MKSRDMANEAIRILLAYKEEYSSWCTAQYIGNQFRDGFGNANPLPSSSYTGLRQTLERLYHAGAINRKKKLYTETKFEYQILITAEQWDRKDPFKKQGSAPAPASAPSTEVAPSIIDAWKSKVAKLEEANKNLTSVLDASAEKLKQLQDELQAKDASVKVLHVKRYDGKEYKLKNRTFPKVFDRVRALAECRRNILLVGPAGCGKTYMGKLVADVLDLEFASLSCTAGMSEAHLLGRSVPDLTHGKNRFQGTDFLRVYENGGIALLDELDAADPNLMLAINTGLANGYMNVPNRPDKPRAERHRDFVCIASANTFGRGATRQYAGRNQLDEATLDRFRIGIVECGYDDGVEKAICPDDGRDYVPIAGMNGFADKTVQNLLNMKYGLRGSCRYIRHKIEQTGLRRIMSSRFMEDAYIMMTEGKWDLKTILEVFFEGWTSEEKAKVA